MSLVNEAGGYLAERLNPRATLTPYERRIIADALAAGRVTVLAPGVAAGLTRVEQQYGAAWVDGRKEAVQVAGRSRISAMHAKKRREALGSEVSG